MVSLGYIRQEKDSKRYRVGRPLFALAASCLDEIEMVNVATPVLEDLSRETGESGHFAVRMGDAVVVIARTSGPGAFQLTDRVGVVRPAHCTALGKMILASLRPEQLQRFLAARRAEALDREVDHRDPARWCARSRRSGAAASRSTMANSISKSAAWRCRCTDFTGQTVGALGISGPIWRLSIQALQKPGENRPGGGRTASRPGSAPEGARPARREARHALDPRGHAFGVDSAPHPLRNIIR